MQLLFCKTVYVLRIQGQFFGDQPKQASGWQGQVITDKAEDLVNTVILSDKMCLVGAVKAAAQVQEDIEKAVITE